MTNALNTQTRKISGLAASGMIALFLVLSGCDAGKDGNAISEARTSRTAAPAPVSVTSSPVTANPVRTVAELEKMVSEAEPESKPVTYAEAEEAFNEKDYEKAVDLFSQYTKQSGENPWGFYMLGLSAYRSGDFETAKTAYGEALKLDKGHVKSWINLSRAQLAGGETQEALASLDSALAIDAEAADAYRLQGRAFDNMEQHPEAIAAYKQALIIDGADSWSMNNLGLVYIEEEQFDKALPPLALAVETDSSVAVYYNNLGIVLEHHGQMKAAADAYRKAVEIDGENQKAADNLSRVEGISERSDLEPIDLAAQADRFRDEMAGWRNAEAEVETEEVVEEDGF